MKGILTGAQQLGRALMLPIAVLPVAALLLRIGQPDVIGLVPALAPIGPPIAAAGGAIFSNLGLLFAIGVAVGLARENHGAAGLAALVCYLVTTEGAKVIIQGDAGRQISQLSIPAGIVAGVIGGLLYNRYSGIQLPDYLGFFAGRRFVPIASGVAGLPMAFLFGHGFPLLQSGMNTISQSVVRSGNVGLFVYGVLNRVLIVTGLHHILNNVAWQLLGEYKGVTGDLNRFFKGDPTAGTFMTGFFPVMMFGLPAACLAMYHTARPERRKAVAGLLVSMALTSFLTGITEPIEFSFMFLAPLLYGVHAILTGLALVVMSLLHVRLGFGFSAGLFDYVLNYNLGTRQLWLIPVGLLYFLVYYGVFRICITAFNLQTPGREPLDAEEAPAPLVAIPTAARAAAFVEALGGARNITSVDACATRLRLLVASQDGIDEPALKRLGARAVVKVSSNALQVVLGPIADQVAGEIRARLRAPSSAKDIVPALLSALGGRDNVREIEVIASSRLRVRVSNADSVDSRAIASLGWRGIARPTPDRVHVLGEPSLVREVAELLGGG
jgi:N-acetylglucosamine PTS system EIICBA or EIICB component